MRGIDRRRREAAGYAGFARLIALTGGELTFACAIRDGRRTLVDAAGETAFLAFEGGEGAARRGDGDAALRHRNRHAAGGDANCAGDEFEGEILALARQRENGAGLDRDDAAVRRLQLQKLRRRDGLSGLDVRGAALPVDLDAVAAEEDGKRRGRGGGKRKHRAERRRCEKPGEEKVLHVSGSFEIRNRD